MQNLTLVDEVRERYPSLSKSQKLIADSILENWEEIAFFTPKEFGKKLGISETTVIRFAQSLGYPSFSQLRSHCQELLRDKHTPAEKMSQTVKKIQAANLSLEHLLTEEVENLKNGIAKVSSEEFYKAVNAIEKARRIYIIGQGVSESLCKFLEFRFRRMQMDAHALISGGRAFFENLLLLNDQDVLIGIGFFRCSKDILRAFDYATREHIPTIALTHNTVSELAIKATVVLVSDRGPVALLNSLVVPMAILNALVLYIAERDEKKLVALKQLDQLKDIFGLDGKE